eukprot:TRINITY_DN18960_c0_g1_i1.p1 TRINITY_DN18960_c0_g1~~TRINITY_DN18960_c0_g1_i1.p1  ORF type:complete len:509 (+),score=102.88 TRINITY_DN18960_c0_g1_i1:53-1579(+)
MSVPVPPSSADLAPQLAVDGDGGSRQANGLEQHSLQLPTRRKPYQRAAIEEILNEKMNREEHKYIPTAKTTTGHRQRPNTADRTLQRQQLLDNINNEFRSRGKPSEQNTFVEKFTLQHFGVKMANEKVAASYNKKLSRPRTSIPRTTTNEAVTTTTSAGMSDGNSAVRKIFERHLRSAQRSAGRRSALRPLAKHSEVTNELYLRHLATKQRQRVDESEQSTYERDPNNEESGCDLKIFQEFKAFCESIKSRAKEAGREADVQSVDDFETQRVLFKKYITHHYNAAKEDVQKLSDDSDCETIASVGQQKQHPPNFKKQKPQAPSTAKFKVQPSPQRHALFMNTKDKQSAMTELLNRQQTVSYLSDRLGQLEAVASEEGTEEGEAIKEEMKRLFQTKQAALCKTGLSRRDPSESPAERSKRIANEIQTESQRQLFKMIEAYTLDHFSVLQRQQTRHQNHARYLFNRAPIGMRKNIISIRQNRMEKQGNTQSACLLFMPPPRSVPKSVQAN